MKTKLLFLVGMFCVGPAMGMISSRGAPQVVVGESAVQRVCTWLITHQDTLDFSSFSKNYIFTGHYSKDSFRWQIMNPRYVNFFKSIVDGKPLLKALRDSYLLFSLLPQAGYPYLFFDNFICWLENLEKNINAEGSPLAHDFLEIEESFSQLLQYVAEINTDGAALCPVRHIFIVYYPANKRGHLNCRGMSGFDAKGVARDFVEDELRKESQSAHPCPYDGPTREQLEPLLQHAIAIGKGILKDYAGPGSLVFATCTREFGSVSAAKFTPYKHEPAASACNAPVLKQLPAMRVVAKRKGILACLLRCIRKQR